MIPYKIFLSEEAMEEFLSLDIYQQILVRRHLQHLSRFPHVTPKRYYTQQGVRHYLSQVGEYQLVFKIDDGVKEIHWLGFENFRSK